ncbi:MAG: hydrogenase maturation nickel metallochaperone HypA [Bacteroidales bacterium]|nr:hydrogenase maturation nickel metallochaperone HypA [Bacteroidales bacterium]
MHEAYILQNILEIAENYAKKYNAVKVHEIEVEIGQLSDVSIEALEFAMQCIERNNLFENTTLKIKKIPAKAKCNKCSHEFEIENLLSQCTLCKSFDFTVLQGNELKVLAIVVD